MADKITAKWVLDEVRAEFRDIEKDSEEVLRKTTNEFASRAPAWVAQAVTDVYNVKKKKVKESIEKVERHAGKIKIAGKTVSNTRIIYSSDKALDLSQFGMKPNKQPTRKDTEYRPIPLPKKTRQGHSSKQFEKYGAVARPTKDGEVPFIMARPLAPYQVTAEIQRGHKKAYTGGVFVANNGRAGLMAFKRFGDDRDNTEVLRGVSVPVMINDGPGVREKIDKRIDEGMSKRLEHHVDRTLARK